MKQRYAFITFFAPLIMYHMTHGCPTHITLNEQNPELCKNEIYVPVKAKKNKKNKKKQLAKKPTIASKEAA